MRENLHLRAVLTKVQGLLEQLEQDLKKRKWKEDAEPVDVEVQGDLRWMELERLENAFFQGEIEEDLKLFVAKTKDLELMAYSIGVLDLKLPPAVSQKNCRRLIGALIYVLHRKEEFDVVCFQGWMPVGGVCQALKDHGPIRGLEDVVIDALLIVKMGLYATKGGDKFFQVLHYKGGWWIRVMTHKEKKEEAPKRFCSGKGGVPPFPTETGARAVPMLKGSGSKGKKAPWQWASSWAQSEVTGW